MPPTNARSLWAPLGTQQVPVLRHPDTAAVFRPNLIVREKEAVSLSSPQPRGLPGALVRDDAGSGCRGLVLAGAGAAARGCHGATVPRQVLPPGLGTGTRCKDTRNVPSASSPPPRVPPARNRVCLSGFRYPQQRSRDAYGSPHPLAVPEHARPRGGRAGVLADGAPAGTSLWPGLSPDGGDSDKWQVPDPGWEQRAGLGKARQWGRDIPEARGDREAVGTGGPTWCHRWERHRGAGRGSRRRRRPRLQPAK